MKNQEEFSSSLTEEEREKRINEQKQKLTRQFTKMAPRAKRIVQSLIDNAAFMIVTLEELQHTMRKSGVVSEYQNGANQWGTKKSPEVEIYNTMIKNHMSIMKQLSDMLPEEKSKKDEDGFESFVIER